MSAQALRFPRQVPEQPRNDYMKFGSRVGKHDATCQATEQRNAEMVLERLDVPADCTVRDVKLFGCERHAQQSCGCFESSKGLQGRKPVEHTSVICEYYSRII